MRVEAPRLAKLVAAACALAASDAAHAQNRMFGVKGGVTLASADIENISGTFDPDNRTGWGIGAFLTLGGGLLSIQPELNFVENGFDVATPLGAAAVNCATSHPRRCCASACRSQS